MPFNLQEIQTVAYFLTTFIMIVSFWRMGGNTASIQVIATYKEQVSQLRDQVASLTAKVGELTGQLKEKDDRIRTLESIATNRNPELETFIKYVTETLKQSSGISTQAQEYMKTSSEFLHEIKDRLAMITPKRKVKK